MRRLSTGSGRMSRWSRRRLPKRSRLAIRSLTVGAACGFHTLIGARAVGGTGRVIAIEADPANAADLEAQVELNRFDNVEVVRKVVAAYLSEPWSRTDGGPVTPTTIDQLTHDFQPPTLIKIDVEGLELEVLRGAQATLREHRPTLVIEAHFRELATAVTARLATLGYRCETFSATYGHEVHVVAKPA